ncbi:methylamine utilization protein MauJ [Priestia megaterium]|uniref:methylamine utilization protein MauJ n=1 Tax=Priestia megaterium TaxID=1404 RepID=UPI0036DBBFD8
MKDIEFREKLFFLFSIKQSKDMSTYMNKGETRNITEVDKVLELFNEVKNMTENKFTIHYKDKDNEIAEVAIDVYKPERVNEKSPYIDIEDNNNRIKYEMSDKATDYYIIWIFKKIFEKYPFATMKNPRQSTYRYLKSSVNYYTTLRSRGFAGEEISLLNMMRSTVRCNTLKITKQNKSLINLDDAVESFYYTYMCNMDKPIKLYSIEDIIGIPNRKQGVGNNDFEAPKRKYNSDLMDYYNLAISSEDPFVTFISYYHIIEYYFDEVYREQQINTLRASITAPKFSYKDDDQLYNIIKKINKDNQFIRENGSGSERPSLNYVLHKFIYDLDDYKKRLSDEELSFYQNHNVSFSAGDIINWSKDKNKILNAISNRIYKTRNALIHSKSSKKEVTYHPYLHKTELEKEINLIRTVAEHIIEANSELLM